MENKHRYFIQYMLRNGCVDADKALEYCKKTSEGMIKTVIDVKNMAIQINREISKQFFKISTVQCEVTEQELFVWINMKNDAISRCQMSFTPLELEYFHAILQEIIQSSLRKITFIVCINITSTLTDVFSRESGQQALVKWLHGGYFVKLGDYIHLGMRTILEFTSYLKRHCPDCHCILCSELVFTGKICADCDKIYHKYCLSRYGHAVCPNCRSDWHEAATFGNLQIFQNDDMADESNMVLREVEPDPSEPGPSTRSQKRIKTTAGSQVSADRRSDWREGATLGNFQNDNMGDKSNMELTQAEPDQSKPGPSRRPQRHMKATAISQVTADRQSDWREGTTFGNLQNVQNDDMADKSNMELTEAEPEQSKPEPSRRSQRRKN